MPPRRKKPGSGGLRKSAYMDARIVEAARVRAEFLRHVADGKTVNEAVQLIGRSPAWYEKARTSHPEWAREVTNTRLATKDGTLPGADFVRFRKTYFGFDTANHHYQLVEAIDQTEPGHLTVVLGFPGMGKTQTLTDWYCYALAEDPNLRIGVISEGQGLSRDIISQVSDRMTDPDRFMEYHARYGPFKAAAWDDSKRDERDPRKRPWTADYFKILASDADQKDPSLASFGATGRVYGKRFDILVADDIQSNETLANTDKFLRSFRTSWASRINLGGGRLGKMVAIGSRVGTGDIYEKLDEEGLIDTLVTIPAMTAHVKRDEHFTIVKRGGKDCIEINPDCPAQPTWPSMSLMDLALLRKKAGEEVWARTYMQTLVDDTAAVFTDEMLEAAKDRTRTIRTTPPGVDLWCTIDPALDSGKCAFLAASMDSQRLYLLNSLVRQDVRTYTDIYIQASNWKGGYRPTRWILEDNNFQKGMLHDDRFRRAVAPADIQSHHTGREKNDAVIGVRMMANAFLDGEISIPWGDEDTISVMQPLIDELKKWRPNLRGSQLEMDRVMTLWFVWKNWQAERNFLATPSYQLPRPSWAGSDRNRLSLVRTA